MVLMWESVDHQGDLENVSGHGFKLDLEQQQTAEDLYVSAADHVAASLCMWFLCGVFYQN